MFEEFVYYCGDHDKIRGAYIVVRNAWSQATAPIIEANLTSCSQFLFPKKKRFQERWMDFYEHMALSDSEPEDR